MSSKHAHRLDHLRVAINEIEPELEAYRFVDGTELPWRESPINKDEHLLRFLTARKGDVARAATMLSAHLSWRRRAFPIYSTGKIAEIINDGRRCRRLAMNSDGVPIMLLDWMFGHYLSDDITTFDALLAILKFTEDELDFWDSRGIHSMHVVSFGGPPPMGLAMTLAAALEANYPERLKKAVVYPVPRLIRSVVWTVLWFLDENTKTKVSIQTDEEDLLDALTLEANALPEFMRGGLSGIEERFKPDGARIKAILFQGLLKTKAEAQELQKRLLNQASEMEEASQKCDEREEEEDGFFWSWACCTAREPRAVRKIEGSPSLRWRGVEPPTPIAAMLDDKALTRKDWFDSWTSLPLVVTLILLFTKLALNLFG